MTAPLDNLTTHDDRGGVRELVAIAAPMVLSFACDTFMTFTDRAFLAKLSPADMNAAMAGGISCFMTMAFFLGLTGYATAIVAQYLGAGRKDRCALIATQALLIALVAYPVLWFGARPAVLCLFDRSGIDPVQLGPQKTYFNILVAGSILSLARSCLSSFFSGLGRTRVILLASLAGVLANIPANYILIFGKAGFPAMGIRGAAYGTIIGSFVMLAVVAVAYLRKPVREAYGIAHSFHFSREIMGKLLRFGSPSGAESLLNILAFTAMVGSFHAHSQATATAATVLFNYDMIAFVPLLGLQVGVISLVGRYMGAGDPDTAARAVTSGLKTGWIYSAIAMVAFLFFTRPLIELFRPAGDSAVFDEAVDLAVFMIRLAGAYVLIDSLMVVFSGALRGAGDTLWAMGISVAVHWGLLPIPWLLMHHFDAGPRAAWSVMVGVFCCFCGLFYLRYRSGKWRKIHVVAPPIEQIATDHDNDYHERPGA